MTMSEEFWMTLLDEEIARGSVSAEGVFQDYLSVRGANNDIRVRATDWLFGSFAELSERLSSQGLELPLERSDDIRFTFLGATLLGSAIAFSNGVRRLSCEVGSIKAPGHGIIKGGGIAIARISHFGIPEKEQTLRLVVGEESARWVVDSDCMRLFDAYDLVRHFRVLTT